MATLTLQTLLDGRWHDAALMEFEDPDAGPEGLCVFEYDFDYLRDRISNAPIARASQKLPVQLGPTTTPRWPAFLDDIRPMGSAAMWWKRRLNISATKGTAFRLLRDMTVAPIGNLRIKESVPDKDESDANWLFDRQDVIDRDHGFLEFAADKGAQIGGATGAGGDAPKLLVRLNNDDKVWIDTWQDDPANTDAHYLVKFPRGRRTTRDQTILRSEYVYYQTLAALGLETISTDGMHLEEGNNGPSLWLPRFDVDYGSGRAVRHGMESVYSLLGAAPGSHLKHEDILDALRPEVSDEAWPELLLTYVKRDLLNLVFGNSDNHGRNIAILRTPTTVKLAPIFDFAPMKMDTEGITRTTKWRGFERGGTVDWNRLVSSFATHEGFVRDGLRALAIKLCDLPELLLENGIPRETLDFPSLGLANTRAKLNTWGLL